MPACKDFTASDDPDGGAGNGGKSPAVDASPDGAGANGGKGPVVDAGTGGAVGAGGRGSMVDTSTGGLMGTASGGSTGDGTGGADVDPGSGGTGGTGDVPVGSGGGTGTGGRGGAGAGGTTVSTGGRSGTGGKGTGGSNAGGSGGVTVGTGGATSSGGAMAGAGGAAAGTGGMAATPAALTGTATSSFGNVEVGVASPGYTWTIRNTGGSPSGTLSLSNGAPSELLVTNNCTGTLAAGASCTVSVTFKASTGGARTGALTLSASPGGMVTLNATATGQYRVTVAATGTGTVTSTPTGITCGTTCTMLIAPGTTLTLQARTTNGSNQFFSGWTGACSSLVRDCTMSVNASVTATATFAPMTANMIFATAAPVPVNKGSAVAYDATCNSAATAAGINNAAGNGYIAYISDAASLAKTRLGSARGWVRMDGRPFADSLTSVVTDQKVFNAIGYSEDGQPASWLLLTGANRDGTLSSDTCKNWTSTAATDYGNVGSAAGGPGSWGYWNSVTLCSYTTTELPMHLICMGTTKSTAVSPVVASGKRIWVTATTFAPGGGQTPDAKCQAERPSGVTTAAALIAYTDKAASAVLSPTATYVRMDGTAVGTGADLANVSGELASASGIWQSADGVYRWSTPPTSAGGSPGAPWVWTGSPTVRDPGSAAMTCGNWTSASQTGMQADFTVTSVSWWRLGGTAPCTDAYALYCVQTAP